PIGGPGTGPTAPAGGRRPADGQAAGGPGSAPTGAVLSTLPPPPESSGAPHCRVPYSGASSARVSRGATNWSARATVCSSTRISQCRFAEYGQSTDTVMPADSGSDSTPVASKVRPGSMVGSAVLTF